MAVSFNGETLIITLESGVTNLDWIDVYTEWKQWMLASPTNRGYPEAFRVTGGDELNELLDQGRYYFLRNDYGWRIRPAEEDASLYVSGNLVPQDSLLDILVPTIGGYTVGIFGLQPITQGFSQLLASGLEHTTYGDAVHYDSTSEYTGTEYPTGTPQEAVNNLTDALQISENTGIKKIIIKSDLDIDSAYTLDGFTIVGETKGHSLSIDTSAVISELTVNNLTLINSVVDDEIDANDCFIKDCTLVGTMFSCGLSGDIILSGSKKSVMKDCYTYDQDDPPVIDMGGSGNDLAMPGYSGLATIQNFTGASNEIGIGLDHGMVVLDSTVTAGASVVIGIGHATNNSTGTHTLTDDYLLDPSTIVAGSSTSCDGITVGEFLALK